MPANPLFFLKDWKLETIEVVNALVLNEEMKKEADPSYHVKTPKELLGDLMKEVLDIYDLEVESDDEE